MAGEWVKRKIGSLGRIVTGKTPPTVDNSNFGGPYPFITIPDLNGRVLIDDTERTLSEKGAKLLSSCLLPPGSVMMSCIATVGKCGITARPSFTNQQINSVIPNGDVDSRFLYYVFTQIGHELEAAGGGGSVYTNVSKTRFADIEVILPPLPEQRAIAHILGTLDDKIELNRRMSQTLEEMARALFKAWFVDFEPVRAKMDGRWRRGQSLPGLPAHLYDLFPDRLVDSELGEIPEGWRVGKLGELCIRIENGGTPARMESSYWGGSIPWFKTGELTDGPLLGSEESITEEGLRNSSCKLWPVGTVLIALYASPTVGRLGILEVPASANQACSALLPKPEYGSLFLFYSLLFTRQYLQQIAVGAAQQNISQQVVRDHKVIVPPPQIAKAFHETVESLYQRRVDLDRESRTLAALRDALLPKLISGELRVRDAERFLKERGL